MTAEDRLPVAHLKAPLGAFMLVKQRANWRRSAAGFTVVELVAVVALVAVLSAVALPRLFDNRIFTERGYADELASALRHAQRIAVASGCNVRFTSNAAGYSAQQGTPLANCRSPSAWNVPVLRSDGSALAGAAPAGAAVAPAVQFDFTANGALDAAPAAISVGAFTVSVDAATGRAAVTP